MRHGNGRLMILKPRRTDFAYKAFIYSQYIIFTFVSEAFSLVGYWKKEYFVFTSIRCIIWCGMFLFMIRIRAMVAIVIDADLSYFLSTNIIRNAVFVGFGSCLFRLHGDIV